MSLADYWKAFVTFARIAIRDTEGLRLGKRSKVDLLDETDDVQFLEGLIDEVTDPELQTKEGWQELKDRISAYSKLGQKTRFVLSKIPEVDKNGNPIYNTFGRPKYMHPAKAHALLIRIVNGSISSKDMIRKLQKRRRLPSPVRQAFMNILSTKGKTGEEKKLAIQIRTDLFVDLKRARQWYTAIDVSIKKGIINFTRKVLNSNEEKHFNSYKKKVFSGKIDINVEDIKSKLEEFENSISTNNKSFLDDDTLNSFYLLLSSLRITEVDSTYYDSIEMLISDLMDGYHDGDLIAKNYVNSIIENIKWLIEKMEKAEEGTTSKSLFEETDFSKSIQPNIYNIFITLSAYSEDSVLSTAKYKQKDDKMATYSSFVVPSFMSDFKDMITTYVKDNNRPALKEYLEKNYLNNPIFAETVNGKLVIRNAWIRDLYEWCTNPNLKTANLACLFDYHTIVGTTNSKYKNKEFESCSPSEHWLMMLSEYSEGLFLPGYNNNYSNYPVFIQGDANVYKSITGVRYNTLTQKGMEDLIEEFYNILFSEIGRIENAEDLDKAIKTINPNSSAPKAILQNKEIQFFYDAFADKSIEEIKNLSKDEIKDIIRNSLNSACEQAFKEFKTEVGFGTTKKDGHFNTFVQRIKEASGVDNVGIKECFRDFFLNNKLNSINQLQVFTISPAFYAHTKELQKRFKEIHASGTTLDPYAIDPTTGDPLFEKYEDAVERCIYFSDIEESPEELHPEFMETVLRVYAEDKTKAEKLIKEGIVKPLKDEKANKERLKTIQELLGNSFYIYNMYIKSSMTDGQGYRTLDSYREVCIMNGSTKWTDAHEEAYQKIQSIRKSLKRNKNITSEQRRELAALAVVFQPLKPYMFAHEHVADGVMPIPVQHKYAEIVLIPELLPANSKLRDMAYYLEDNSIDLACSDACVKVGAFGTADIKESKDAVSMNNALSQAYVHKFHYSSYRIQTNVPVHNNTENQLFGTQPRKLLISNINHAKKYKGYIPSETFNLWDEENPIKDNNGEGFSGSNIINVYNALICANIFESYEEFQREVGDISNLSKLFLDNITANERILRDRILAYSLTGDAKFMVPLNDVTTSADSQSFIYSLYRKMVNKQRIKGGSLVQASALGLKGYEEDGSLRIVCDGDNILYEECEVPFMLNWTDSSGKTHDLKFSDWCNSDGTLKLGRQLDESDPEYKKYQSYRDSEGKVHKPLIEESFPDILSIVAYRIPTERGYSILNLKIVRFSDPTSGGTIKVPLEGAQKSGFDFDIDKLYFMMKSFRFDISKHGKSNYDIWKAIYKSNPEIFTALSLAKAKADNADAELISFLTNLLEKGGTDRTGAIDKLLEELSDKTRLLDFWEDAGLPGTAEEAFSNYILQNIYKFKLENLDDYDFSKPPMSYSKEGEKIQGNTKSSRNNLLLHMIQARMSDPETIKDRITPGSFINSSNAARLMREIEFAEYDGIFNPSAGGTTNVSKLRDQLASKDKTQDPEPNYDPSDVRTVVYFNKQNQIAKKVIGIAANQNAHHAYISIMHTCKLKTPIAFGNHSNAGLGDFINGPEGINVDVNVAEFLAAAVDAVKDPVLNYLNINEHTASIGITLARLGYTAEEIGLLFTSPIIKRACKIATDTGTSITKAVNSAVEEYYKKSKGKEGRALDDSDYAIIADMKKSKDVDLSVESLIDLKYRERYAKDEGREEDFIKHSKYLAKHIKIAEVFTEAANAAAAMNDFIQATKFTASNSVGSTAGHFYNQQLKVEKFIEDIKKEEYPLELQATDDKNIPIINNSIESIYLLKNNPIEYMMKMVGHPFAFEQMMYDMNREVLLDMSSKYYPYETTPFKQARKELIEASSRKAPKAKIIDKLHEDLHLFIFLSLNNSIFRNTVSYKGQEYTPNDYYDKYFAKDLMDWLDKDGSIYSEMPIFKSLVIRTSKTGVSLSLEKSSSGEKVEDNIITDSWAEAFQNEQTREWAGKLFIYSMLKNGFSFSPIGFSHLAPSIIARNLIVGKLSDKNGEYYDATYSDVLERINTGAQGIISEADISYFMEQFMSNHYDSYDIMEELKDKEIKESISEHIVDEQGVIKNSFELSQEELIKNDYLTPLGAFLLRTPDENNKYKPVKYFKATISGKDFLFTLQENSSTSTNAGNPNLTYNIVLPQTGSGSQLYYESSQEFIRLADQTVAQKSLQSSNEDLAESEENQPNSFMLDDDASYSSEDDTDLSQKSETPEDAQSYMEDTELSWESDKKIIKKEEDTQVLVDELNRISSSEQDETTTDAAEALNSDQSAIGINEEGEEKEMCKRKNN